MRRLLLLLSALLLMGCASTKPLLIIAPIADGASTEWAKGQGAREANPLLQSRAALWGAKGAEVASLLWLDSKLKGKPKLQQVLRVGVGLAGGWLTLHNMAVGREAQQHATRAK